MNNFRWPLHSHKANLYAWFSDIFTYEELDQIFLLGNRIRFDRGVVGSSCGIRSEKNLDVRDSLVSFLETDNNQWIFRKITDVINHVNNTFFNFELHAIETLQYSLYDENGFYGKHIDMMPNSSFFDVRKLSFSILLSDPKDYEGGDLLIYNGGTPEVAERKRGIFSFFPSFCLHEVTPVTRGIRKSLVGWVTGPPFR